jgi:hypothetical protein
MLVQNHPVYVHNTYIYQSPEWGGHWRYGYSNPGFSFSIGLYAVSPFNGPVYVSPWYYYSNLPPYVPAGRVEVIEGYSAPWNVGTYYSYHYGVPGPYQALNTSLDALYALFSQQNTNAVTGFLPYDGQIAIFTDGHYDYSLSVGDFQNMLVDNATATQTRSYSIDRVRRRGEDATVQATHIVTNSAGGTDTVYHEYHLRLEGGQFVVRDFMTSHTPFSRPAF